MKPQRKWDRCMVMGGGGGRLGIYLGMYAAACEAGQPPDLLVATCGGALAAAIIHTEPDPQRQLDCLASPEMYRFWRGFRHAPQARLSTHLIRAVMRWLDPRMAPTVPRLYDGALFVAPPEWPGFQWCRPDPSTPTVVILGGRLLYPPEDTGRSRGSRKLFQQTVFCSPSTAEALVPSPAPLGGVQWPSSCIAGDLALRSDVALGDAVRISFTDMFYLPAALQGDSHFIGGVVDLMPVELASRWAHEVWIERKAPATWTLGPAWRHVLGIDARRRLAQVDARPVALRLDTAHLSDALPRQLLDRRLKWAHNQLQLAAPSSHADYRARVQAQWQAGRHVVLEALASSSGVSRLFAPLRPPSARRS